MRQYFSIVPVGRAGMGKPVPTIVVPYTFAHRHPAEIGWTKRDGCLPYRRLPQRDRIYNRRRWPNATRLVRWNVDICI